MRVIQAEAGARQRNEELRWASERARCCVRGVAKTACSAAAKRVGVAGSEYKPEMRGEYMPCERRCAAARVAWMTMFYARSAVHVFPCVRVVRGSPGLSQCASCGGITALPPSPA